MKNGGTSDLLRTGVPVGWRKKIERSKPSATSNAVRKSLERKREKRAAREKREDELRARLQAKDATLTDDEKRDARNLLDVGFRVYQVVDPIYTPDSLTVEQWQRHAQNELRIACLLTSFDDDYDANWTIAPEFGQFPRPRCWKRKAAQADWDAAVSQLPDWLATAVRKFSDDFEKAYKNRTGKKGKVGAPVLPTWVPPTPPLTTLFPMGQEIRDDVDDATLITLVKLRFGYLLPEPVYEETFEIRGKSRTVYALGDQETGVLCAFGFDLRVEDFAAFAQICGTPKASLTGTSERPSAVSAVGGSPSERPKFVFVGARVEKDFKPSIAELIFRTLESKTEILVL